MLFLQRLIIIICLFLFHPTFSALVESKETKETIERQSSEEFFVYKKDFEKFVKKYSPPDELKLLIEKYKDEVLALPQELGVVSNIPGYIVKNKGIKAICRVINAERMRSCMQKLGITLFDVPKKYLYKIDGQWYTFAELVEHQKDEKDEMSLEQVKQAALILNQTGFSDFFGFNRHRNRGRLVFIDTENNSFGLSDPDLNAIDLYKYHYVRQLKSFKKTPKAEQWLEEYLKKLSTEKTEDPNICFNENFDHDINFSNVKKYWRYENEKIKRYEIQKKIYQLIEHIIDTDAYILNRSNILPFLSNLELITKKLDNLNITIEILKKELHELEKNIFIFFINLYFSGEQAKELIENDQYHNTLRKILSNDIYKYYDLIYVLFKLSELNIYFVYVENLMKNIFARDDIFNERIGKLVKIFTNDGTFDMELFKELCFSNQCFRSKFSAIDRNLSALSIYKIYLSNVECRFKFNEVINSDCVIL